MKTSITYRHVESQEAVESAVDRYAGKISKLLRSYDADLVQLHGSFDKQPRRSEYSFSLTLSLPTGRLHTTGEGPDPVVSVRRGFAELESQLKKHMARLRKDHEWKRKRGRAERALA